MGRRTNGYENRTAGAFGEGSPFTAKAEPNGRLEEDVAYWQSDVGIDGDADPADLHKSAMGSKYLFAMMLWFSAIFLTVLACYML